ncbi:MAG: hypothetical protein M3P06_21085 [Acidobacteriota bacterium]|nr:hypothetical protein [Acidobacteriota bacterium]
MTPNTDTSRLSLWLVLLSVPAFALVLLDLQWGQKLSIDEFEFFRASRWIAEGRVPYRDFWEHHLPLQWVLFAPVAALVESPGAEAILAMRWAQLPLWIAVMAGLMAIMKRAGMDLTQRAIAVLLLVTSTAFVRPALEFRVDTAGNLGYIGALALVLIRPSSRPAWISFGAIMSAAVLANMRLAPLVVATAALLMFADARERHWRFRAVTLWMIVGVAAVAVVFAIYVVASGAVNGFVDGMRANIFFEQATADAEGTLSSILLAPVTRFDPAGIALLLAGLAGVLIALREIRRPGPEQVIALLAILSLAAVVRLSIHYPYHLQTTQLLLAITAASILRPAAYRLALLMVGLFILASAAMRIEPAFGKALAYQDVIMREVDRRTGASEQVFDGVGVALHRQPAYRYWFLPAAVRLLALRGLVEPYDAPQMAAAPPAAVVHSYRVHRWLQMFPSLASYTTHHYIPLYRDLWIPAPNALLEPGGRARWLVPRNGRYRLMSSQLMAKHPWFRDPLRYAETTKDAAVFEVPLAQLPPGDAAPAELFVNGSPASSAVVLLRRGDRVEVRSMARVPVAVFLLPEDVTRLFMSPVDEVVW